MKCRVLGLAVLLLVTPGFHLAIWAQDRLPAAPSTSGALETRAPSKMRKPEHDYILQPGEDPENRLVSPFIKHVVADQKEFWTEPTRLRVKDLKWIAPFVGVTSAFIASDSWWSKQVTGSHVSTSKTISDYGTYSLMGLGGASFLLGQMK